MERRFNKYEWTAIFLCWTLLGLLVISLAGCKTVEREVPVVVEHTTSTHSVDVVRDTLLQRDSVFHYIQGDTVRIERWHYTTRVEVVERADTVRDTIPAVVTVKEVVTQPRKWWDNIWVGIIAAVIVAVGLLIVFKK